MQPGRWALHLQQKKWHYASSEVLLMCFLCAYTRHDKDSIHYFWTAITVPLRKLSRWVWNMQQFVWSLRCLFRTAFACNYNKLGSMPCYWCIPFVLRSNFLFLREKKPPCVFFFFNVQPTSVTTHQSSGEIALNLGEWLQDCNCCKKKNVQSWIFVPGKVKLFCD